MSQHVPNAPSVRKEPAFAADQGLHAGPQRIAGTPGPYASPVAARAGGIASVVGQVGHAPMAPGSRMGEPMPGTMAPL